MHNRITKTMLPAIAVMIAFAATATAEEPAYRSLSVGQTVEAEGEWKEDDSIFVAEDVELLPMPRRPKLRGSIVAADSANQRLMMFGQWIEITEKTQFIDVEDASPGFSLLKRGDRIEVSCKVDTLGTWTARHIRVGSVKGSNKIKGTISAIHFDGKVPEVIEIEGLPLQVHAETVIYKTLGAVSADSADVENDE